MSSVYKDFNSNLSLVLLVGLLCKKFPLKYAQHFLQKSLEVMLVKHKSVFQRLSNDEFDFIIDCVDLPFVFYLKPSIKNPVLRALRKSEQITVSATIRGDLISLLGLFEGKIDGDAAFFSKELIIEGSTAAIVALRNAVDSEDMNIIEDLSEIFSPMGNVFSKALKKIVHIYGEMQENMEIISDAITSKTKKDIKLQEMQLDDIFKELDDIHGKLSKLTKEHIRKKSDYSENL